MLLQFDDLIKKIGELIDKLGGPNGLGDALNHLPSPTVDVNVKYRYGNPQGPNDGSGDGSGSGSSGSGDGSGDADNTPRAAVGGYFPAKSGGTLVRLAEGGQGEYVVPKSLMTGLTRTGSGMIVVNVYQNNSVNGMPTRQMGKAIADVVLPHVPGAMFKVVAG